MLGLSLVSFDLDRVRLLVRDIAVRWLADVEAIPGVNLQAAPGQLQHVEHVPLGDGLLDPPRKGRCRSTKRRAAVVEAWNGSDIDALVCGQQGYTGLLQLVLDL